MSKPIKSKLDQFATVLAEMDAATKTLAEIQAWLKAEGCSVSTSRLSEYLERLRTQRSLQQTNDLIATFEDFTRKQNPDWSADRVREVGIQFFMAHATAQKDADQFATIVSLDQNERFGRTKGSQKEREIALKERKFIVDSDVYFERLLAKANELNASTLSNAEKIAAMRAEAFKSVDELQASGKIKIPQE